MSLYLNMGYYVGIRIYADYQCFWVKYKQELYLFSERFFQLPKIKYDLETYLEITYIIYGNESHYF